MCQCGCEESHRKLTLPGPYGMVYIVEIANGCQDCETPAGVVISLHTADSSAVAWADGELKLQAARAGLSHECAIAIAEPHSLVALVRNSISKGFGVADWVEWPEDFALYPDELELEIYANISGTARAFDGYTRKEFADDV